MSDKHSPQRESATAIADVLNRPERDSAYYSNGSGDSKHTSVNSTNPSTYANSPSAQHFEGRTPPPINTLNQPMVSPSSASMSVAAIVSPSSAGMDRSMLDRLSRGATDASQRSSYVSIGSDARRESVDSRSINAGLDGMRLSNNSPYQSNHPSSASFQTSQSQRDPRNGPERLSASRFPSHHSRDSMGQSARRGRDAPPVVMIGPAARHYAHNAEPVQGQAWAGPFGGPESLPPTAAESTNGGATSSRQTSFLDGSRRNSVAESFRSDMSQLTAESALPRGQRRLDEGYADGYPRRLSIDVGTPGTTHHHQMQHRQLGDIRDQEGVSPNGTSQPYSRTPELRVSHKLAERKRRDEMKQLYDNLRELMPQERGAKASKWEILSKAISEHKDQAKRLDSFARREAQMEQEMQRLRADLQEARDENHRMRTHYQPATSHPPPHTTHTIPTQQPYHQAEFDRGMNGRERRHDQLLPGVHTLARASESGAMDGVQYQATAPPVGGYRHDSGYGRGY